MKLIKDNTKKLIFLISLTLTLSLVSKSSQTLSGTQCHPQCSWKCDDPHCPAICDPVCEPPKCHTSCAEPRNAICDVKCEKPECEIKCPDKGCEMYDCPKCVTVCKQPHCVTHCQAPKPECEAVCEEPRCDWKCHKPACPKPKCELVCENPNCVPKVDCCPCAMGAPKVATPFPFFKETENNQGCCGCNSNSKGSGNIIASETPQVVARDKAQFNTTPSSVISDDGHRIIKNNRKSNIEMFDKPIPTGTSMYTNVAHPNPLVYGRDRSTLNLDLLHKDK